MGTGLKAQGHKDSIGKLVVQRHGSKRGVSRASYHRAEKALETVVRRAGKKACRDGLVEVA